MALIKCPDCGKEVSEHAITCPNCGYPIAKYKMNTNSNTKRLINNKIPIRKYIKYIIPIVVVIIIIIFFCVKHASISQEYCEGLKWGSSLKDIEKKYSDLTYSDSEDYYFTLTNSLADYKDSVDMQFYFDETDKLYKIKASIVNTDIEDAVSYFVDYFNQLYNTNYGIYYDTEYKWYGDKTNITLQATTVLLEITYEEVDP